jgi:hypothetical protein
MSFYPHTRQLGSQAGVQLNPPKDNTDGFVTQVTDQTVSFVGRFKRGRIDVPFKVNRGNLVRKLGAPESIRVSALNECYVQVYEAVNNGAREAVISRLAQAGAWSNKFLVFNIDASGVGQFTAAAVAPTTAYVFYLKDLECFNDGVLVEVNAVKTLDATNAAIATKVITVRIKEPDGTLRYEVTGSLDNSAKDEYLQDFSLVGKMEGVAQSNIEITCNQTVSIATTAECYGKAADGTTKLSKTATPLALFTEGGTTYIATDFDNALAALEKSTLDYGYASSGGSQNITLISKMATMNMRANRLMAIDVPGTMSPAEAATWVGQLGITTANAHLVAFYWAPIKTDDPLNGGRAVIGTSGLQCGYRCSRNAQTNSYGLAPKNYPIAGKDWAINRTSVQQLSNPDEFQLSDLADAQINPVIYQNYGNNVDGFVFYDSLTAAKTNGYRKLISVAEMSSSIDDAVAKVSKSNMQLPMDLAITRTTNFLKAFFKGAKSSGWLVASEDAALGDAGWTFTVQRNAQRPSDRMDIAYGLHYDGVARAIYIQQTISA